MRYCLKNSIARAQYSDSARILITANCTLNPNKIPARGEPNEGYQPARAGAWDAAPDTNEPVTGDVTYTFTFAEKGYPYIVEVTADRTQVLLGTTPDNIVLSNANAGVYGNASMERRADACLGLERV